MAVEARSAQRLHPMAGALRRRPRLIGLYPPFLGAGIRVEHIDPDFRRARVRMRLRWWNRNLFGTHFGGSLYAMCDPFLAWLLMVNLGPGYQVWDKAATVRFLRPGRGTVTAELVLPPETIAEIQSVAEEVGTVEPGFTVTVRDDSGKVVAKVEKLLHVKRV